MCFRLFFLILGVLTCVCGLGENPRSEFWGDLIFHSNVKNDRLVATAGNRRHSQQQPAPQVLMTECPLNSRCVGRNFCDENGLITTFRTNKLRFSEDDRGLIACVDTEKNRLGVCCIDRFRVINGRRKVRQDDLLKVSEDGVVTLDTSPGGVDDSLITEEEQDLFEEALEEEFSILESIGDVDVGTEDRTEIINDPSVILSEEDIENIVESVKQEDGRAPSVIMVNDEANPGKNIAVRFLPGSQMPSGQAGPLGPIVVINIHADSLGLGGRDGDLDFRNLKTKLSKKIKLAPVEVEKSIPKKLKENDYDDEVEDKIEFPKDSLDYLEGPIETPDYLEDPKESPDYLDFDTDYITITMETEYQDGSAFRGDYNGNTPRRRQFVHRPGMGNLGNRYGNRRRPAGRPARHRRPVFRFRPSQN